MFILTVVAALLLTTAAVAYVTWPLVQQTAGPDIIEDDRLTELIARKDATLIALKELEFDHDTGKLSEDDFQRMETGLRRQAIGYIKAIEKQAPESAQMEERIEAEISSLRKTVDMTQGQFVAPAPAVLTPSAQTVAPTAPVSQTTTAQASTATMQAVAEAEVRFCTNCGHRLSPMHKFCGNCGAPVAAD